MLRWFVSSAALAALVIALRYILRGRIGLRLQYALWALLLLRLLLPVSFGESRLSVQNILPAETAAPAVTAYTAVPNAAANAATPAALSQAEHIETTQSAAGAAAKTPAFPAPPAPAAARRMDTHRLLRLLWAVGAVLVCGWMLYVNLRFASRLRRTRRPYVGPEFCPLPVYVAGAAETPCLFGLFPPAVYLTPEAAEDPALGHILAHEYTHYCHGDHLWALLRGLALALHWFDPLVWWAAALSRRDGELACDEGTLRRLGEGERESYGRTLIRMTAARSPALFRAATTMTGSKGSLRERVRLIAKGPKTAALALAALVLIAAVGAACTFTGAGKNAPQEAAPEYEVELAPEVQGTHPEEVLLIAQSYAQERLEEMREVFGLTVTSARITGLTPMEAGTVGLNEGRELYLLEYRFRLAEPEQAKRLAWARLEGDELTEQGYRGQPYLLLRWEAGELTNSWSLVCATDTQELEEVYGTPFMLENFGNKYTAASVGLYTCWLDSLTSLSRLAGLRRETVAAVRCRFYASTAAGQVFTLTREAEPELVERLVDMFSRDERNYRLRGQRYADYPPNFSVAYLDAEGNELASVYEHDTSTISFGDALYWTDFIDTSPFNEAYSAAKKLGTVRDAWPWVTVSSGDIGVRAPAYLRSALTWSMGSWLAADGEPLEEAMREAGKDTLPLTRRDEIILHLGEGLTLASPCLTVYDEDLSLKETVWEDPQGALNALGPGTWWCSVRVLQRGDYIPQEEKYEQYCYDCIFRLVVREALVLSREDITLLVGDSYHLRLDPDSQAEGPLTWTVDDESVVTVEQDGTVTAVGLGAAHVTASAGDKSATCIVRVRSADAEHGGVRLSHGDVTLHCDTGETFQLRVNGAGEGARFTYASSDEAVASVDGGGLVKAVSKGTATVTVTVTQADETETSLTCTVRVVG